MAKDRLHWPPPPSTPREAPWREIEEVSELLKANIAQLQALTQAVAALAGIPVPTPPVIPPAPGVPSFDGRLDDLVRFSRMAVIWGQATGGTLTKLVDQSKHWKTDMWAGYGLAIVEGTGAGQAVVIKTNDSNSLTPDPDWVIQPDSTSYYVIFRRQNQIIAKAALFNSALPAAEANWLDADIIPSQSPSCLRIYVCTNLAGIIRVARTRDSTALTEDLYSGLSLTANAAYLFTIPWRSDDRVNIRYSTTGGIIRRLLIDEIGVD